MRQADFLPPFCAFKMIELSSFYNDGSGWVCRQCELELTLAERDDNDSRSRLLREGEAEGKHPKLSHVALARWADRTHRTLMCPRCGITELVEE